MVFSLYPTPVIFTEVDTDALLLVPRSAHVYQSPCALRHPIQWHSHRAARQLAWQLATGTRTLAGIRGNCHITATLAPKTSLHLFSSLSATGASVPGSPLRSPDLRKYAGTVWPRVLCLKYTLSGKDFKMWDKPPLPPSGDPHCGRREPIP